MCCLLGIVNGRTNENKVWMRSARARLAKDPEFCKFFMKVKPLKSWEQLKVDETLRLRRDQEHQALRAELCCSRGGLPLVVSKASTVYGLQGDTVGSGRNIERIRVLWSKEDGSRTPRVFYVAVSRAKEEEALAFDVETSLDDESMDTIGISDEMGKRVRKTKQILKRAEECRQGRMQVHDPHSNFPFSSKGDFLVKIERLLRASRRAIQQRKSQRTSAGKDPDGFLSHPFHSEVG